MCVTQKNLNLPIPYNSLFLWKEIWTWGTNWNCLQDVPSKNNKAPVSRCTLCIPKHININVVIQSTCQRKMTKHVGERQVTNLFFRNSSGWENNVRQDFKTFFSLFLPSFCFSESLKQQVKQRIVQKKLLNKTFKSLPNAAVQTVLSDALRQ